MALILLIEHQTLVRDAIRHFLFPQHVVVSVDQLPTPEELPAYDLAIVDTETLPLLNQTQDEVATLLSQVNLPAVWMCPPGASMPESDAAHTVVEKPLDAEAFGGAVERLLPMKAEVGAAKEPHATADRIIELTDVIPEELGDDEQS